MATFKGSLENDSGDKLYPESSADIIKTSNNSDVQTELSAIPSTYLSQADAASTYATKDDLSNLSAGIITVVPYGQSKPATGTEGIIYLVQTTSGGNVYDKFAWENNAYVSLGSTSIDLSNYVQKLTGSSPAGTTGESTDKSLDYGDSFKVHQLVVNADGQVTAVSEKIITLPASDNTDTVGMPVVESGGSAPSNLASGALFFRKAASA